ncbi:MAG: hypothetical protein KAH93_04790 [Candidatus Aenigmarchaeota archaeon]|nr:hypothetical protein [Candidatus Aenigmarchaeota archaeon]
MNDSITSLKEKRDELNSQVKQLLLEVKSQRDKLNSINEKINDVTEKRDAKNNLVKELIKKRKTITEKIKESRATQKQNAEESAKYGHIPKDPAKLKAEIKKLDWDIQTRQHTVKQDEQMQTRLEQMENSLALVKSSEKINKKLSKTHAKISDLEEELELIQQLIVDNNHAGKKEHEELTVLYNQIKGIRTDAAPKFRQIKELKKEADDTHHEYIGQLNKQKKQKQAKIESEKKHEEQNKTQKEEELKKKAKDLYTQFIKGKKLTGEELIIIRKYGQ